jgi:hypothetical protein
MTSKPRLQPRHKLSYLSIGIFFFVTLMISNSERIFRKEKRDIFRWDGAGYYAYLPAAFIYQDFSFDFYESAAGTSKSEFSKSKGQASINKFALGPAMLLVPFFLGGHGYAIWIAGKPDGFSAPYRWGMLIGAAFFAALGLWFLYKVLSRYFKDYVVALTLLAVGFGTNLFYYTTFEPMMSHVYSFCLFSLAMWLGMRWKEHFEPKFLLMLSLVGGLIAACRITNVVFLLVPLLWGVHSLAELKSQVRMVWHRRAYLLPALALLCLPLLPQLAYLKSQTGSFLVNPYVGEPFFWTDPRVFEVLLSYRKGWLVYTPMIAVGLVGWVILRKHPAALGMAIFMVLNLYIVSSWWCWWYGGGFGMRAMIEASAPMSIGIAASIDRMCSRRGGSYVFAVLFPWVIALNLLQTHQYSTGIIHWDAMTKKSYWEVFGVVHPASDKIMSKRDASLDYPDPTRTIQDQLYRSHLE